MGRAPATALAYMFWLRGWQLPEALQALTSVRRCSPRVEAIRAATADLLTDSRPVQLTVGLRRRGTVQKAQVRRAWLRARGARTHARTHMGCHAAAGGIRLPWLMHVTLHGVLRVCVCVCVCARARALCQVAGLDVGWHTLLDLVENPTTKRLEVTRQVLPGSYPFKFILDGTWCPNMEYPTYQVRVRRVLRARRAVWLAPARGNRCRAGLGWAAQNESRLGLRRTRGTPGTASPQAQRATDSPAACQHARRTATT
jgi:hypothetical protein